MTHNEAIALLDKVMESLNNRLDSQRPLTNEEIESLISDIDKVQEGILGGLSIDLD